MWFCCHQLTPRHSGGVVGLTTVQQQQPPSQMPLQAYANYAMGSPQADFSFRVQPPTLPSFYIFICLVVCSGVCFLLSGAMLDAIFTTHGGSTHWGLYHCNPLELTHVRHICNLVMVSQSTPGMHRVAASLHCFE